MKVIKRQHTFRKYQHWVMATLWLGVGLIYILVNDKPLNVMSFLYFIVGIGEISLQFFYLKKGRAEESIFWNEEVIIVQELFQKPKIYDIEDVDQITVTPNNFLLKSGKAKGIMLDLKGFTEEDIKKLQARFAAGPVLTSS
ncbi:hypothetical protein FHG64_15685 [Antarcticibacterium flavum]|uniref:Uncharacterized protein n=1 Tax=Antarcticibacterium flavum TaxID=2058175 RepID=A0A5B7X5J2_9FLAO|nr:MULTISPECIES: hypothetical protein [Antarcticibacterium]MCM4159788.1 hypothetical protein [Antarcticibacterium sp. W02-3]QCY70716.1 hypothetical protein FHG64_15685 [Antarcticibacterium flavum]